MNDGNKELFVTTPGISSQSVDQIENVAEPLQVNLENVEDMSNVCRTCATITEFVVPIFENEGLQNNLAEKIHKHLPIKVLEKDDLPTVLCYQCASTLLAWHELVECCVQAQVALTTRLSVLHERQTKPPSSTLHTLQEIDISTSSPVENIGVTEDKQKEKCKDDDGCRIEDSSMSVLETDDEANETESSYICEYCNNVHTSAEEQQQHLVSVHADLLFHCDECDTYVDRRNLIIHMSLHAAQYAAGGVPAQRGEANHKRAESKKTKNLVEMEAKDGNLTYNINDTEGDDCKGEITIEVTEENLCKTKENVEKCDKPITVDENNLFPTQDQAFSDHSGTEDGFGPLPESVFEAIEDSQDSQIINEDMCPTIEFAPSSPRPVTRSPQPSVIKKKKQKSRTCPVCTKVFKASSSYFYHVKHVHDSTRQYACEICNRQFATRSTLAQHASIHSRELRFECVRCGKRFRSRASLYIHSSTHEEVREWSCHHCHRAFRWRQKLLRHMQRHAAPTERAYVCSTCGRAFAVKCDLIRHMRTHSHDKPYACEKCSAKFAQRRYLHVHIHKQHVARIKTDTNIPCEPVHNI